MATATRDPEIFPPQYTYPPFYTRQLNATAWTYQRTIWAQFILRYCKSKKMYKMNLADALESELFWNRSIGRRLKQADAIEILDHMSREGNIEWVKSDSGTKGGLGAFGLPDVGVGVGGGVGGAGTAAGGAAGKGKISVFVWWRKPEEWANIIYDWIDATGQKNTVLTLYEISEGDLTVSQEFHGMDSYCIRKSLEVLTKRGVAQIFSINDEFGIKFF